MTNKLSIFKISGDSFQVEYENPSEIIDIISRYSDRKVEVIPNQNLIKISGAPKKSDAPEGFVVDCDMLDADPNNAGTADAASAFPSLSVNLYTNYDKVFFGAPNKVYGLIEIKAPEKDDIPSVARKALNIIAVIDVSGSMSGAKIECARDSVIKLIENLTEIDTFGIVLFDTNVKVLSPMVKTGPAERDELKRLVSGIASGSSTNMAGGITEGFEQFKKLAAASAGVAAADSLNRMIVFTDGMANIGVTAAEGFVRLIAARPAGLSISTFGYGADHDENLLKQIADNGRGNYYYIQNMDFFLECLATELGGLLTTFARDISVEIRPSINVSISRIVNGLKADLTRESAVIDAEDIQLGEKKYIAVWFSLPQVTKAVSMRQFNFAEVKITCLNNYSGERTVINNKFRIGFVKTPSEKPFENEFVREKVILLHFAVCQKQAMLYADAGDIRRAQEEIKKFISRSEKHAARYPGNKTIIKLMEQAAEVLEKLKDKESYTIRRKELYIKQSMFEKQRTYSSEDSSVEFFETNEKLSIKDKWRKEENERKRREREERDNKRK
jgi:Ca-activated chloride channel family protein